MEVRREVSKICGEDPHSYDLGRKGKRGKDIHALGFTIGIEEK